MGEETNRVAKVMTQSSKDVVEALDRAIQENERMIRANACATDHRENLCAADIATLRAHRDALLLGGWRPISEAKEGVLYVVGWIDPDDGFDRQAFDSIEDGVWERHEDSYQHYRSVAFDGPCRGPIEQAPYTHCIELQPLPKSENPTNG